MERDRTGKFVARPVVPQVLLTEATGQRLVRLLEQIAYNTSQTHLTCREYLQKRVYADHPAAD